MLAMPTAPLALHTGVGLRPPMGYCSWNDCASEVTEQRIKNVTRALISSGLAAKGYTYVNVDEGWLAARDASGALVANRTKFPSGMAALGAWVHSQRIPNTGTAMRYGLYTSRGSCQCSTKQYEGPGSAGHIAEDVKWMVAAGADFLKVDSCCGSQVHEEAFRDYERFRDELNATGRRVFLAACGWRPWYAPRGDSLAHSWRIALDGTNWATLSECVNINAGLSSFARPGAFNDPDLLQGTGVGSNDLGAGNRRGCFDAARIPQSRDWYISERQQRAQFSLWAVMSSPLLISADPAQVSPATLEIWGNEEVIAVNQEFREGGPYQGSRLVGGDLHFDVARRSGHGANVWGKPLPAGAFALAFVSNGDAPVDQACDRGCYASLLARPARAYTVRDLWARRDLGTFAPPQTLVAKALAPHGGAAMVRLEPCAFKGGAGGLPPCRYKGHKLRGKAFEKLACREAEATGAWGGDCGS